MAGKVNKTVAVDPQKEPSPSEKKSKSGIIFVSVAALLMALFGGVAAAQVSGMIDVRPMLANVPYVGPLIKEQFGQQSDIQGFQQTLEERDVAAVKAEMAKVEAKLSQAEAALQDFKTKEEQQAKKIQEDETRAQEAKKQVSELQEKIKALEQAQVELKATAKKISLMKPAAAVPILNNLPDDTVRKILAEFDDETVAKFYAAMDPVRVARLTYPDAAKESEKKQLEELTKGNYQELAATLSNMKPEAAVIILEQISQDMAVSILKEMDKGASANILSVMDPSRAAAIVSNMGKV